MKLKDVKVGAVYVARVSGKLCRVRIDAECEETRKMRGTRYDGTPKWGYKHGGWNATNLDTGRTIYIRSAARLRATVIAEFTVPAQPAPVSRAAARRAWHNTF